MRTHRWKGIEPFMKHVSKFAAREGIPGFSGISGGRTSALMAVLHSKNVVFTFQNTGREHEKTYEFLDRLDHALGGRIVWLEWRPPTKHGAPPREFRFEIVNYKKAARNGEPFRGFLQALADFRKKHKGLGPVSPWALSRICTAYMKQRTQENWIKSQGITTFDSFVGLRADEPERVHKLKARDTQDKVFRCPLFESKIVKADILSFWAKQSFNLELEEHQGNCTACFLKDQTDISRVLGEEETDAEWWLELEQDFPRFGGEGFPGYRQLLDERPMRLDIERELRSGAIPLDVWASLTKHQKQRRIKTPEGKEQYRRHLVILQEKRRLVGMKTSFSCNCEGSDPNVDDRMAAE